LSHQMRRLGESCVLQGAYLGLFVRVMANEPTKFPFSARVTGSVHPRGLKEQRKRPANYHKREPCAPHELKRIDQPFGVGGFPVGENPHGQSRPYGEHAAN
jgi:hypothetical protein